jgi:hypothetical protein
LKINNLVTIVLRRKPENPTLIFTRYSACATLRKRIKIFVGYGACQSERAMAGAKSGKFIFAQLPNSKSFSVLRRGYCTLLTAEVLPRYFLLQQTYRQV